MCPAGLGSGAYGGNRDRPHVLGDLEYTGGMPTHPAKDHDNPLFRMSRCCLIDEHLRADAAHVGQDQGIELSVDGSGGIGTGMFSVLPPTVLGRRGK